MDYLKLATESIQNGKSERALILVQEFLNKNEMDNTSESSKDLMLLSSRLTILNRNINRNVIDFEESVEELNKINIAILDIIETLSKGHNFENKTNRYPSLNIPKIIIDDSLYFTFIGICSCLGIGFSIAFVYFFNEFTKSESDSISRALFIGSLGVQASGLFSIAFQAFNRNQGLLVNWKVLGPHLIIVVVMLIGAAILQVV